jgi:hypothetical protein
MSIQPLTPQSPARVAWETKVAELLCGMWDCCYSDATGCMSACQGIVDRCFAAGASPQECAGSIDAHGGAA